MISNREKARLLILIQWAAGGLCLYQRAWASAAFIGVTLLATIAILQTEK